MKEWILSKCVFFSIIMLLSALLCHEFSHALSASFSKSDSTIDAQIVAKIAADPHLAELKVQVNTKEAVVGLTGQVKNSAEAAALLSLAQSIAGVKSVDISGLVIETGGLSADEIITSEILGIFVREGLDDQNIKVVVKNRVVTLSGTVDSDAKVSAAEHFVGTVSDVQAVRSSIGVRVGQ